MAGWLDNVFWPRPLGATTPEQLRMHQHRVNQRRVDQQRVRGNGASIEGAIVNDPMDISVTDLDLATTAGLCVSSLHFTVQQCVAVCKSF
jgi:hypothetical protein